MAWSVARRTSFTGQMDPVVYDEILVNVGNPWLQQANVVMIPTTGYYYLYLGAGVFPSANMFMGVYMNSVSQFGLGRWSTNQNGIDMISRSAILHLTAGSLLSVRCTSNGGAYSDDGMQSIFIGFRIY